MSKKNPNQFAEIIAARNQESIESNVTPTQKAKQRTSKRGNPDYSAVTVYIPTDIYTKAQIEMVRRGRKREMSELFSEILTEWLERQT